VTVKTFTILPFLFEIKTSFKLSIHQRILERTVSTKNIKQHFFSTWIMLATEKIKHCCIAGINA